MKQFWFKTLLGVFMVAGLSVGAFLFPRQAEAYQDAPRKEGPRVASVNCGTSRGGGGVKVGIRV